MWLFLPELLNYWVYRNGKYEIDCAMFGVQFSGTSPIYFINRNITEKILTTEFWDNLSHMRKRWKNPESDPELYYVKVTNEENYVLLLDIVLHNFPTPFPYTRTILSHTWDRTSFIITLQWFPESTLVIL